MLVIKNPKAFKLAKNNIFYINASDREKENLKQVLRDTAIELMQKYESGEIDQKSMKRVSDQFADSFYSNLLSANGISSTSWKCNYLRLLSSKLFQEVENEAYTWRG